MREEINISEEVNALVNEHYKPQSAHGIMVCERWARAIQLLLNQQIQLACLNWRHRDAALQTKIAALEAEVGELRKDKERLDWLSDSIPTFSIGAREKAGVVIFTDPCDFGGRNLREAIDTALNSTKGEK